MDKRVQFMFAMALGAVVGASVGAEVEFMETQFMSAVLGSLICSFLFAVILKLKNSFA